MPIKPKDAKTPINSAIKARIETKQFVIDELGAIHFLGEKDGESYRMGFHDPFEQRHSRLLADGCRDEAYQGVVANDTLHTARAIALSVFGPSWEAHVIEIYDRLLLAPQKVSKGED